MMRPSAHGVQAEGASAHLGAARFSKAEPLDAPHASAGSGDRTFDSHRSFAVATAAHGAALMLAGCVWGLLPPSLMADHRAYIAVHHMFTHQGELLFGMACAWQFLPPSMSRRGLGALFWLTVVGAWCNPIGYLVAALSGQGSDLVAHATKHLHARGGWTTVTDTVLKTIVAPSNLLSFAAWLVLMVRSFSDSASRPSVSRSTGAAGQQNFGTGDHPRSTAASADDSHTD